jgi:hypothetical protein
MYDPARPIRFISVDAAVDHFVSHLPVYRAVLKEMERLHDDVRNPEAYRQTKRAIAMLEDPADLRARFEKLKAPDGTLNFENSSEVANRLRKTIHDTDWYKTGNRD